MRWLGFIVILITSVNCAVGKTAFAARNTRVASSTCLSQADVSDAVQRLSSLNDLEMAEVKKVLFRDAARSRKCRQQVITTLMKAMDKPNLDLVWDRASYSYWHYGARLLGELKATEALDLLIAHLNATDGRSPNMTHYPAVNGVIAMGSIAIPKLAAALGLSTNPILRTYAIFCIASIGGNSAKVALKEALDVESDQCNRKFIDASLNAFKNRRTPNRIIFDPERSKWYAAFDCHD